MVANRILLSSKGRVLWSAPRKDATSTYEQRTMPDEALDVGPEIRRFANPEEKNQRRFHHGLLPEVDLDSDQRGFPGDALMETSAQVAGLNVIRIYDEDNVLETTPKEHISEKSDML